MEASMAKRMGKGLIALSSAAVVAVYGVGYLATEPAAVSMAAGLPPDSTSPAAAATATQPSTPAQAPASTPAQAQANASTASTMKDGSYQGTGWSRRGSVSVTVQNGKITAAPITGVTTHYSQSLIAGLPAEVVGRQSSHVDMVSGATDSSMAYQQAVAQALAQAGGQPAQTP